MAGRSSGWTSWNISVLSRKVSTGRPKSATAPSLINVISTLPST